MAVHCYIDTGKKLELADKSKVPILRPQTAFGYFVQHDAGLVGWETRIYDAEKLAEDLYVIRVPNNGSAYVDTAIQARENDNDAPLPPDGTVKPPPDKCKGCLAALICFLKNCFTLSEQWNSGTPFQLAGVTRNAGIPTDSDRTLTGESEW